MEIEKSIYTDEVMSELTTLAKKHDITQLLYQGLITNGIVKETDSTYKNSLLKTIFRLSIPTKKLGCPIGAT